MSARETVCLTFAGNPAVDSRCLKMAVTLSEDYSVHIIALMQEPAPVIEGVVVHRFERRPGEPLRKALFRFWKSAMNVVRGTGASLYFACDLYSLPLAARAAAAEGRPYCYDSRELYSSLASLQQRKLMQRFWNIVERRYAPAASAIYTVNHEILEILLRHYPQSNVEVIHNFPGRPAGKSGGIRPLRRELGIRGGAPVLISNGGLQQGRGLFRMIDLLPHLPECTLVFLGDGPLRSELEVYAHGMEVEERVLFIAVPAAEVVEWTAEADIGLCFVENLGVSYYLSLPNKLFEYLHAGIPCVCTDLPVIKRVMEDTKAGLLIRHTGIEEAVTAIRYLLGDKVLYNACRNNALRAAPEYSWDSEGLRLQRSVAVIIASNRR